MLEILFVTAAVAVAPLLPPAVGSLSETQVKAMRLLG